MAYRNSVTKAAQLLGESYINHSIDYETTVNAYAVAIVTEIAIDDENGIDSHGWLENEDPANYVVDAEIVTDDDVRSNISFAHDANMIVKALEGLGCFVFSDWINRAEKLAAEYGYTVDLTPWRNA